MYTMSKESTDLMLSVLRDAIDDQLFTLEEQVRSSEFDDALENVAHLDKLRAAHRELCLWVKEMTD